MEGLKELLKEIERLSLDPFRAEELLKKLEELFQSLDTEDREHLAMVYELIQGLKPRLEENYIICFGWMEEAFKGRFERKA